MAIIYKIQNKIDNKIYIGQSANSLEWRLNNDWCGHFTRAFKEHAIQSKLYAALRKYGKDGFTYEIIEDRDNSEFSTYDDMRSWLNLREQHWIDFYDSINTGYNMHRGSKGYSGWSKEARQRWSIKMKEQSNRPEIKEKQRASVLKTYSTGEPQKKISEAIKQAHQKHPEIIDKIRERSKDSKWMYRIINNKEESAFVKLEEVEERLSSGWALGLSSERKQAFCYHQLGKPRTEEEKAKISKTLTGKKKTKEHAKHISEGLKGRVVTDEMKKNISEATRQAMLRPEVRAKMSAKLKGRHWINNGHINKLVKIEELDSYLANGFIKGKIPHNMCWINNGHINKQVKIAELNSYLTNGFMKGMLKNENKRNKRSTN